MKKGWRNTGLDKTIHMRYFFFFRLEQSHQCYTFLQISSKFGRNVTFFFHKQSQECNPGENLPPTKPQFKVLSLK